MNMRFLWVCVPCRAASLSLLKSLSACRASMRAWRTCSFSSISSIRSSNSLFSVAPRWVSSSCRPSAAWKNSGKGRSEAKLIQIFFFILRSIKWLNQTGFSGGEGSRHTLMHSDTVSLWAFVSQALYVQASPAATCLSGLAEVFLYLFCQWNSKI